jgi:hypothetical protein
MPDAMHLLPQSFVFQATHSPSQGAPDGKSLMHFLPRQAFSFPETIKL